MERREEVRMVETGEQGNDRREMRGGWMREKSEDGGAKEGRW